MHRNSGSIRPYFPIVCSNSKSIDSVQWVYNTNDSNLFPKRQKTLGLFVKQVRL